MKILKNILAIGVIFGVASFSAHATLTTETVHGQNLVYNSGNNTTWIQDANLLGTLEAKAIVQNGSDDSLITNIINASGGVIHDIPNSYDNGTYSLSSADFGFGGVVNWWAAQAFVHYLDTQDFGGSNHWALPASGQLNELFYNELGGTIPSGPFNNVQSFPYWSGTEVSSVPDYAWFFNTNGEYQGNGDKSNQFYVMAESSGNVAAAPVPSAFWLFTTGILGIFGFKRSRYIR